MRTPDGRLIADLNDTIPALVTGSVAMSDISDIDENLTTYALLPERINFKPYASGTVYELSTPQIKPIQFNDPDKSYLYVGEQGTIKVAAGTSFTLRFRAMQPPIDNVENGKLVKYEDQTQLLYEWQKDGQGFILNSDPTRPNSTVQVTGTPYGTECVFTNVSTKFAGVYTCTVTNDIGSITSEDIFIEVDTPDLNDLFYKNLIQNPNGKESTDQWEGDQGFVVGRLNKDAPFKNYSQPWKTDLFGYTKDMFYPRPYHINTYHVRNSDLEQNINQDGYYFTRDKYTYTVKGGKEVVSSTYEVDLTDLKEYIQGSIYGVDGVRAVFGCYIGNAVSRYRVTLINALITKRSNKFTLIPNQTRLSILNILLAGIPDFGEQVTVNIQEYDEETQLLSTTNSSSVAGYDLNDPWTTQFQTDYGPMSSTLSQGTLFDNVQLPDYGNEIKAAYIVQENLLYPSKEYVATYGQYVKFNRYIIDKLNYKTTKIKITVNFITKLDLINDTDKYYLDSGDDVFEFFRWEWITKPLHLPRDSERDFIKSGSKHISIVEHNINAFRANINEPYTYGSVLGAPRGMATGFNLVLFPLESTNPIKSTYYTDTILSPIDGPDTRVQDMIYPQLVPGIAATNPLSIYMSSLYDYDYDIIGVNITNTYNTTPGVDKEGSSGIASKTSIKTYVYDKSSSLSQANPLNFDSTNTVWKSVDLTTIPYFKNSTSGGSYPNSLQIKVLYNTAPNADIVTAGLPQVVGSLQSDLIKYTNNLITDVPATYATASSTKGIYNRLMGFNLILEGDNYGVPTDTGGSFNSLTDADKKSKWLADFNQYSGSAGIVEFGYKMLQSVSNTTTNYIPSDANTQVIVYNTDQYNKYAIKKNVLDLSTAFTFTEDAALEKSVVYTDTAEGDYTDLTDPYTMSTNTVKRAELQGGAITYYAVDGALKWIHSGIDYRTNRRDEYGYDGTNTYYRITLDGISKDRVKLVSTTTKTDGLPGVSTPAAIIIPDRKKIYYFIYNYIDNYKNE